MIEEMRQKRESLPVFVDEVADHILETLAPDASQEEVTKLINIAINWWLSDGPEGMTVSRGLYEEMGRIVNLLRNAAQVVDGKDGTVEIAVESREDAVTIRVDDAGPGVASKDRSVIFEPGVSRRDGGSGHGLALVREVIEVEMGGRVSCEDSPLGGARFFIVLPLRK